VLRRALQARRGGGKERANAFEAAERLSGLGEISVIRQAISCDVCATEKQQTNHWFVASEQSGELRVSGWNSRNRLRPGMKHLCGQTCLHKLVDEFMARTLASRPLQAAVEDCVAESLLTASDASLTSQGAPRAVESAGRFIGSAPAVQPKPVLPKQLPGPAVLRPTAEVVAMPDRLAPEECVVPEDGPRYTSRNWRAEAWDRERERELRAVEHGPDVGVRRRSGS
jgi:hypothetical protein